MERSRYQASSIDLVFDEESNKILRDISASIDPSFGGFIPHITIFATDKDRVHDFQRVLPLLPKIESVSLLGLSAIPVYEENKLWLEVAVSKTGSLTRMRQEIANHCDAALQDNFRPHITLGCINLNHAKTLSLQWMNVMEPIAVILQPETVVGRNGELGKVVEIIK